MALTTTQENRVARGKDLNFFLAQLKTCLIDPVDKRTVGEITLSQLNAWGASSDTNANAVKALAQTALAADEANCLGGVRKTYYTVRNDDYNFGSLAVFGDDMGHGVYEVLQTSCTLVSGQISTTHVDGVLHTYYRFLPAEAHNGTTKGVWTAWKPLIEEKAPLTQAVLTTGTDTAGNLVSAKLLRDNFYIKSEVDAKVASVYKPAGSIDSTDIIPSSDFATPNIQPQERNLGNVYNIKQAFTTTDNFVEGTGKHYPAGTNVVCVLVSEQTAQGQAPTISYKWDVLAGFVDLSGYVKITDIEVLTDAEIDQLFENA